MSKRDVKTLHVASSLAELNKYCDIEAKFVDGRKLEQIKQSCELLLQKAKTLEHEDEEVSYCSYMRAVSLFSLMRKRKDYDAKYFDAMLMDSMRTAMTRAQKLSEILEFRYDKLQKSSQPKTNADSVSEQKSSEAETGSEKRPETLNDISKYYHVTEEKADDDGSALSYMDILKSLSNLSTFMLMKESVAEATMAPQSAPQLELEQAKPKPTSTPSESSVTANDSNSQQANVSQSDTSVRVSLYPSVAPLSTVLDRGKQTVSATDASSSYPRSVAAESENGPSSATSRPVVPSVDRSTKPRVEAAKVDDPDGKRPAGASSELKRSNSLPQLADVQSNSLKPQAPAFDRSTKPNALVGVKGGAPLENLERPSLVPSVTQTVDRSAKPSVLSRTEENVEANNANGVSAPSSGLNQSQSAKTTAANALIVPQTPSFPQTINVPAQPAPTPTIPVIDRSTKPSSATGNDGQKELVSSRPSQPQVAPQTPAQPQPQPQPVQQTKKIQRPTVDRAAKPIEATAQSEPQRFDVARLANSLTRTQLMDLEPRTGRSHPGLTGLFNMHNTCFFNSAIQALSHTPGVIEYFIGENKIAPDVFSRSRLTSEWTVLLRALWCARFVSVRPTAFARAVQKRLPDLLGAALCDTEQQDAQEFLMQFLDVLHDELNEARPDTRGLQPKSLYEFEQHIALQANLYAMAEDFWKAHRIQNNSIIVTLFQGLLLNTIVCRGCRMHTFKFEPFQYLSVPLPQRKSIRLEACLKEFLLEETIDDRKCDRCGQRCGATKKLDIIRLPNILAVHLKRFQVDPSGRRAQKRADWVVYQPELDLFPFLHRSMSELQRVYSAYTLYAVVNHSGTLTSGHYTANVMHAGLQNWFRFDDEQVSPSSMEQSITPSAYILFYSRTSLMKYTAGYRGTS